MEAKIRNGGTHYDVAFPSEYTVQKLKKAKLLETLNHDKIPNIRNLDNDYMNLSYDPNNRYSIPYFFGTVGILYDKEKYPNETLSLIHISEPTRHSAISRMPSSA